MTLNYMDRRSSIDSKAVGNYQVWQISEQISNLLNGLTIIDVSGEYIVKWILNIEHAC